MKKTLFLVCLALLIPSISYANDDSAAKINLVKQVYQEARNPERLSSDILKKYADPSFKKALNVADVQKKAVLMPILFGIAKTLTIKKKCAFLYYLTEK